MATTSSKSGWYDPLNTSSDYLEYWEIEKSKKPIHDEHNDFSKTRELWGIYEKDLPKKK